MILLELPITESAIEALKKRLTVAYPDIKHSWRCEAMARAFGYATYAAMRDAAQGLGQERRFVYGLAFEAFLKERGHTADREYLYRAVAQHRMEEWEASGMLEGETEASQEAAARAVAELHQGYQKHLAANPGAAIHRDNRASENDALNAACFEIMPGLTPLSEGGLWHEYGRNALAAFLSWVCYRRNLMPAATISPAARAEALQLLSRTIGLNRDKLGPCCIRRFFHDSVQRGRASYFRKVEQYLTIPEHRLSDPNCDASGDVSGYPKEARAEQAGLSPYSDLCWTESHLIDPAGDEVFLSTDRPVIVGDAHMRRYRKSLGRIEMSNNRRIWRNALELHMAVVHAIPTTMRNETLLYAGTFLEHHVEGTGASQTA